MHPDAGVKQGSQHQPPIYCTAPVSSRAIRELATLPGRGYNFDPAVLDHLDGLPGWHIDHDGRVLPSERPGDPVDGGSFLSAKSVLKRYEFADQKLIRAAFRTDQGFDGRNMLLEGRFFGLRFPMGVRIGGVVDEDTEMDFRPVRRFAWRYRTLEGHLERGQMDYELLKWRDTGAVELRIRACSARAPIRNPVVRLGFRLFARRRQLRFYERALERTYQQVIQHAGSEQRGRQAT